MIFQTDSKLFRNCCNLSQLRCSFYYNNPSLVYQPFKSLNQSSQSIEYFYGLHRIFYNIPVFSYLEFLSQTVLSMKEIMENLFRIPFKADLFHRFLRIDRTGRQHLSIKIIGDSPQFIAFSHRCLYCIRNFHPALHTFTGFQQNLFLFIFRGNSTFSSQIDSGSYILPFFHALFYQNLIRLGFLPVCYIIIIVIPVLQKFLRITPFIGFVIGPAAS